MSFEIKEGMSLRELDDAVAEHRKMHPKEIYSDDYSFRPQTIGEETGLTEEELGPFVNAPTTSVICSAEWGNAPKITDEEVHAVLDELIYDDANEKPTVWIPTKPWYARLYNKFFKRKQ